MRSDMGDAPHSEPLTLGWDFSNYDADLLGAGKAEQLLVRGIETIQGFQNESIGNQLIDRWRGVGGTCAATYAFLYWDLYGFASRPAMMRRREYAAKYPVTHTSAPHFRAALNPSLRATAVDQEIAKAIRGAQRNNILWVGIDCEHYNQEPPGITVAMRQREYMAARQQVLDAGLNPFRYSTLSFWANEMGALDIPDPWWGASYGMVDGQQPPPAPIRRVTLNGTVIEWLGHQYASLPPVAGRARDYDYYFKTPWSEDMAAEDDLVMLSYCTNEELRQLKAGTISRVTAVSNARGRMSNQFNADNPRSFFDTLFSHVDAHPGGTGEPHQHTFEGSTSIAP